METDADLPWHWGWTCSPWTLCGDLKTAAASGSTAVGPSSVMAPVSCTWRTGCEGSPTVSGAPSLQDTRVFAEAKLVILVVYWGQTVFKISPFQREKSIIEVARTRHLSLNTSIFWNLFVINITGCPSNLGTRPMKCLRAPVGSSHVNARGWQTRQQQWRLPAPAGWSARLAVVTLRTRRGNNLTWQAEFGFDLPPQISLDRAVGVIFLGDVVQHRPLLDEADELVFRLFRPHRHGVTIFTMFKVKPARAVPRVRTCSCRVFVAGRLVRWAALVCGCPTLPDATGADEGRQMATVPPPPRINFSPVSLNNE